MGVIVVQEDDQSRKATLILDEEATVSSIHVLESDRRHVMYRHVHIKPTSISHPFEEREEKNVFPHLVAI